MKNKLLIVLTLLMGFTLFVSNVFAATKTSDIEDARSGARALTSVASNGNIPVEYSEFTFGRGNTINTKDITGVQAPTMDEVNAWSQGIVNSFTYENGNIIETVTKAPEDKSIVDDYSITYTKVGTYNGQWIDAKAIVTQYALYPVDGKISMMHYYTGHIGNSVAGIKWVRVRYEFYKHGTDTPVSVKGNTSYWDIDGRQGIVLERNNVNVYATDDSVLKINTTAEGKKYIFDEVGISNSDVYDTKSGFTETFEGTSITRIYQYGDPSNSWDQSWGGIFHNKRAVVRLEIPEPTKTITADYDNNLTNNNKTNDITAYTYNVTQAVPMQSSENIYTKFEISDTINSNLNIVSTDIVDENNRSVKDTLFDINQTGQTVTAVAKATALAADSDMYDNTFTLKIKVLPKNNTMTVNTTIKNSAKTTYRYNGDSSDVQKTTNETTSTYIPPKTPTKAINKNLVKQGETFEYTVTQQIQPSSSDSRYTSFVFTDALKDPLTATTLKIYQGDTDVTNWFTVNVGQTVTATLNDPSRADFYGTRNSDGTEVLKTYKFVITAKFKDDAYITSNATGKYSEWTNETTAYKVPNTASITTKIGSTPTTKTTNEVYIRTYYEPSNPVKTVNLKYVNDITTFEYRVSQIVPTLRKDDINYTYKSFIMKDTIGKTDSTDNSEAFDLDHIDIKIISTKYGENRDFSRGDNKYFNVNIDRTTKTITATARAEALANEDFYGTTYEMVISAKIKENYFEEKGEGETTIINNRGTRTIQPSHVSDVSWEKTTNEVPTTHVNPINPKKTVDTEMVRYDHEYHYTITEEIQPATQDNYYDSYVFTDVLEPPLYIKDVSKVKITQIDGAGEEKDYTDKFNIALSGKGNNTITATLKNPKDSDFYGTRGTNDVEISKTYEFELTVALRDNAEKIMDMSAYAEEDGLRYIIPNVATITSKTPGNEAVNRTTNEVQVYYYPEPEPTKTVSQENITDIYRNNNTYTYTIQKRVLSYDENIWYKSLVFKDTLEDCLESSEDLVIKNEAGIDLTKWFDVKVDGQTITATLKDENNNDSFYGHTYSFIITAKVKQNYDLNKWKRESQYVIPNEASFTIDDSVEQNTNKKDVHINIIDTSKITVPNTSKNIPLYIKVIGILLIVISIITAIYISKGGKFASLKKIFKK